MRRAAAPRLLVVTVTVAVLALMLGVVTSCSDSAAPSAGSGTDPTSAATGLTAAEAGQAFLDGYVDPDGRVVRRDQGDDTVSEGQAYAMLVAVALGDQDTFSRVWSWTQQHLLRADGTLSWRWGEGRVLDDASASDADLDAARALVLAGRAFARPQLLTDATTLGTAVLDVETASTSLGRILLAGSWANAEPYAYNPSYASPAAFDLLASASADARWAELAEGSRRATTAVLDGTDLPPDWAQIRRTGEVEPMPGAAGHGDDGVIYGYDATRLPLRYAESCHPADVALAARLSEPLESFPGTPATRDLGGRPLTEVRSVVAIAAQAAAAAAHGDQAAARAYLVASDQLQLQSPTYYGGAWDALGRLMLTGTALGGCPPLAG